MKYVNNDFNQSRRTDGFRVEDYILLQFYYKLYKYNIVIDNDVSAMTPHRLQIDDQ